MYYGRATVQIEKVLSQGIPRTALEISRMTGIERDTVSKSLSRMVKRGDAYVSMWKRETPLAKAYIRPAYSLGIGESVKKPERLTPAQRQRRHRRKTCFTSWQPLAQ